MKFFGLSNKPESLDQLQGKISLIFTLLAGILMIFLGISDYAIGLNSFIITVKFAFAIPFLVGYWVMMRHGYHQIVLHFMIGIGFLTVAINYFNNEGFRGPTMYTIFIFIMVITILIKGWTKVLWYIFSFFLYGMLFYGEVEGWFQVNPQYSGMSNLLWDHWITIIWCSLFTVLAIQFLIKNYRLQNQMLSNLQNEKERAVKELSELNGKKNQLIALLSHDLKNPIGTLSTTLEFMDSGIIEEGDLEKILHNLKGQSFHLNKVLHNTLSWVMTEMDQRDLDLEIISPVHLTREMQDTMLVQASGKNQKIDLLIFGEEEMLPLETNEIKIILKNLLDNALKFSTDGATVDLRLFMGNDEIRWEVSNIGRSISKEIEEGLFEFKVKTSYGTQKEKGAGIGLPLCKKIADKLGFELGFEADGKDYNTFYLIRKSR